MIIKLRLDDVKRPVLGTRPEKGVVMNARSHGHFSLVDAVETLSEIVDLEIDRDIGITQKHELVLQDKPISYNTVHWLTEEDASTTINLVKETYRVILHYLKQFYKKEYGYITEPKTVEGIKTIMVLVGEAAKKLDRYTELFHLAHQNSVTECKEYKQLQEFYLSKIARRIDEGVLGKWILALYMGNLSKQQQAEAESQTVLVPQKEKALDTKHVFVDLETVKKDTEYELFFIRKENGTRFFSPRLLRNVKLVCDFGSYFGERRGIDPLENVNQWMDRVLHMSGKNILKALGTKFDHFFTQASKIRNHEVGLLLSKALMALLLSSYSHNLLRHDPIKSAGEYFGDFLKFLREALNTRTYQKWLVYPPGPSHLLAMDLLDLTQSLCKCLYTQLIGFEEMIPIVRMLLQDATQQLSQEHQEVTHRSKEVWSRLAGDYTAMTKLLKNHPNGPLVKVMNVLEEDSYHVWDPLMQQNIPSQLFDLYLQDHRISSLRIAAPVSQEVIDKANLYEEFKALLRGGTKKMLVVNLQDRTSWREHARSLALEELQKQNEFKECLSVVTLAIDTEFYHQLAPYHQMNHANQFIKQFKEHLKGEESGFYFPGTVDKTELYGFIDKTLESIHKLFFFSKNVLTRESRLDFIEIFYLFLVLKLSEMVKPDLISLTCKDGIDIGPLYNAELFVLFKLLNQSDWTEHDTDYLNFILYAPALLFRERLPIPERFNRMISALKVLENAKNEWGASQFPLIIQESFFPLLEGQFSKAMLLLPC